MPSDDLPGLEPDPTPEPPPPPPPDPGPKTYDGLTNAELDEWFEAYGGQAQFDTEHGGLLEALREGGIEKTKAFTNLDPDLEAVIRGIHGQSQVGLGAEEVGEIPSIGSLLNSSGFLDGGWLTDNWSRLGPELKARFRRFTDSKVETTTPLNMEFRILMSTLLTLIFGGFIFSIGLFDSDSPTAAVGGTAAVEVDASTAEPSDEAPLPEGADETGDMFGSSSTGDPDSPEAAAADITATAYFFDDGAHVFQMKVRGDGEAVSTSDDTRWYKPRFIIQTSQGEFTIDVDASDGTARVIDSGPFSDPQQIVVDVVWLEPGCLQVAATVIGLTEEATSFRTELSARLEDGTTFEDDASFGE